MTEIEFIKMELCKNTEENVFCIYLWRYYAYILNTGSQVSERFLMKFVYTFKNHLRQRIITEKIGFNLIFLSRGYRQNFLLKFIFYQTALKFC